MMSDFFTSVEFYITAFAVAVAILVFFASSDDDHDTATSDLYSPTLLTGGGHAEPSVTVTATDDGSIKVTRHGLLLPPHTSVYIKAETVKDRITLTEKLAADPGGSPTPEWCTLQFATEPQRRRRYYVRYEVPAATQWCIAHIANYGGDTATRPLRN